MNDQLETDEQPERRGEWKQRLWAGEGTRRKTGLANKWGVAQGSGRVKVHMIRMETWRETDKGNIRVDVVSKWWRVWWGWKKNITGRETTGMGEGGEIKRLTLVLCVCVCGLLATLSAMHLVRSYWICTKQDVSLVTRASDRQYHPSPKWKTELHAFAASICGIPLGLCAL